MFSIIFRLCWNYLGSKHRRWVGDIYVVVKNVMKRRIGCFVHYQLGGDDGSRLLLATKTRKRHLQSGGGKIDTHHSKPILSGSQLPFKFNDKLMTTRTTQRQTRTLCHICFCTMDTPKKRYILENNHAIFYTSFLLRNMNEPKPTIKNTQRNNKNKQLWMSNNHQFSRQWRVQQQSTKEEQKRTDHTHARSFISATVWQTLCFYIRITTFQHQRQTQDIHVHRSQQIPSFFLTSMFSKTPMEAPCSDDLYIFTCYNIILRSTR